MLNLATATAAEIVRQLPFGVTFESATDIVAAFRNNPDRTAYDLEVLTGYPITDWLSLLKEGVICISPKIIKPRKMGCELAFPQTLPTSAAGEGSLTGLVDSGEYLAPQSSRGHDVGDVRDSSRSTHEGPIHDDMINKILTVLPRSNIYQPPLAPGDDTETLSLRQWRGEITYPSGPLKVHNWPNPVNSMAKDSKRDSQTVQFSGKPAPDLGQSSEYCVNRSARSRKGGYSGDRNRDSSSVAGGYLPAYDSKDQERGHVSQHSSFAVTSGLHTVVDSQLTGTHQPVFPYHQSYVSQREDPREDPCHGQAYQSLTKPKVGDYRNQSSTTHPIVLESGYPSDMLSSNCLFPSQVEK